ESCTRTRHLSEPTLFPYTTPFRASAGVTPTLHPQPRLRSNHHGHPPHHDNLKQSRTPGPADAPRPPTGHPPRPYRRANQVTVTQIGRAPRLNSSHVKISYAVFCLK